MPGNRTDYQQKEIEIVRKAIDLAEARSGRRSQRSPEIKKIINILEKKSLFATEALQSIIYYL